jgi:hypothetical protein
MLGFASNFRSECCAIVGRQRVTKDLDALTIVHTGNGLHQMRSRMITEIRGNISDTKTSAGR